MKKIYFDHAATTYVDERVVKKMLPYFTEIFGNPGSANSFGQEAKFAMDDARGRVAKILGCDSEEVIFTSGGTESVNLALKGFARANKDKGNHIVTSAIEHKAVLESCEYLEKEGFKVTYLKPDKEGKISVEQVREAIKDDTILVSIMYANNEIGTINDVKGIAKVCSEKGVIYHTDACQAAGSQEIRKLGVDMMSINGSKIYAPKGIGVLFKKKDVKIDPIIHGGGQEFGLRAGTENVPYMVGFAEALVFAQKERVKENSRLMKLRDRLIDGLLEIDDVILNGHAIDRLPNNVNVSVLYVEGESLITYLDHDGICVNTGSACTSKSLEPSYVLTAIGLKPEEAHGSIRFTLGHVNTEEDIDHVLKVMPKIVAKLRKVSPLGKVVDKVFK